MGYRWGAAFVRIGWQASFGLGGSFAPDWVAGITGIRNYTTRVIFKEQVTMEEIVFNLKHHWSSVDCQELELYGIV